MTELQADIDATCASLGYFDGQKYLTEPDVLQGLKHLIWILRRDGEVHEYRRHIGRTQVLQDDLLPILAEYNDNQELSDVLLRLLVNLTNPALLLYREELPKDGPGRRNFLELIEILQRYKQAFASQPTWTSLGGRLQKTLEIEAGLRGEEHGLLIERTLVLIRNVLQVPANADTERRADNDASLHDQVLWALQQAGIIDLVLFIIASEYENQYHLHALEIIFLMLREQTPSSLADASLQRSAEEKYRDEQELIATRRREKAKLIAKPPPGRHSRFGGTYVLKDVKSISDNDIICHQSLQKAYNMDFDVDKAKQKKSHRVISEDASNARRSAFSIRLFLREFCIEVLSSAFNNMVRQVRRTLDRNGGGSAGHDDSYLLWAIQFFMEFNRLNGFQLQLVSETLTIQCFHWVLTRIEHDLDMLTSDKKNARLWARRLHIAVQAYRELLQSLQYLQKMRDETAKALFKVLQNNVFYVLEYRESVLHLLMNYNENFNTKSYLRDLIELAHIYFKMMEKFCQGTIVVQDKRRKRGKSNKTKRKTGSKKDKKQENREELENNWARLASQLSAVLSNDIALSEEEHPIPFDAAAEKNIDDQKEDCMIRLHHMLRDEKFEHAVLLMRAAREVWPDDDCFGSLMAAPEDELMILHEIFTTDLGHTPSENNLNDSDADANDDDNGNGEEYDEEDEESTVTETNFRFEDFVRRLVNPKVVYACVVVLTEWEKITTRTLKSAVTILHRIAFACKCPAMLYQASLFRIFQRVLSAVRDPHNDELKKLSIYVIRKFVEIAPSNPKIYAELLFYKTIKEANDLECGYDSQELQKGTKGAWSECEEDELRRLFMENQASPATNQDVIDWLLDNLINQTRTRRGVLKKLKELGLIFKAPTKRTNAVANKNVWTHEQDDRLRILYDEHRANEDALARIMEAFSEMDRSKNNIIKRMIQLGLIADRTEILPKRSRKSKGKPLKDKHTENGYDDEDDDGSSNNSSSDDGSEESDMDENRPSVRPTITNKKHNKQQTVQKNKYDKKQGNGGAPKVKKINKITLNVSSVKALLTEMTDDYLKSALEWVQESLLDVAEDKEDISEDPDDGIPLVPLMADQRDAMENEAFKKLLKSIDIQMPDLEVGQFWRIPAYMSVADLKYRAQLLSGEDITIEENGDNNLSQSDDEDSTQMLIEDDAINENSKSHKKPEDTLIYNESDDETETRKPLRPLQSLAKNKNAKKSNKINIAEMVKENSSDDNNNNDDDDDEETLKSTQQDTNDVDSQNLRLRLAELVDTDDESDDNDNASAQLNTITSNTIIKKRRTAAILDSSDSENESTIDNKSNKRNTLSVPSSIRNVDENVNNIEEEIVVPLDRTRNKINDDDDSESNKKRERSDDDTSDSSRLSGDKTNKKRKIFNRSRKVLSDSSDEE